MRLAFITPGFSASEHDWCIPPLLDLVRVLAQRHEVEVFTLRYPHRRDSYNVYGATIHAFGGGLAAGVQRLPLLTRALGHIVKRARQAPFDLIHGLWADEPGFVALVAARLLRVPSVVSILGGELVGFPDIGYGGQLSRAGRWLSQVALREANAATVGSHYLRHIAQAYVRGRLQVTPLGVDNDLFQPQSVGITQPALQEGDIKLLHVASLVPVKDQITLIKAVHLLVQCFPGLQLHIVGEGSLRAHLEQLTHSLGITHHVNFHGSISHEKLPSYYRAADLCVLSSRHESQGMVTLEAAACGRLTVGTAVGILPQISMPSRAVPVGDAHALYHAIRTVIEDEQLRHSFNQACQDEFLLHYTLSASVARFESLYAELR